MPFWPGIGILKQVNQHVVAAGKNIIYSVAEDIHTINRMGQMTEIATIAGL